MSWSGSFSPASAEPSLAPSASAISTSSFLGWAGGAGGAASSF
eukprot:CAMPEP_0182483702 /NCGR_PEP_ID=MMETSP1319-20130603/41925_1 /TAXON_ID=172717 /ORGANISM="Bolidomonas pacifica, Strain RCC208" /LENGTH=42 /DNA_ID= /DNA_START= /DNA_END= /DNA_ORIENTATION=